MHSRSDARLRNQEQNQLIQIDTVAVAGFHAEEPQNCFTTDATTRESYRLSTFSLLPHNVVVNICQVAAHGFYLIDSKSLIKCFSCGATARLSIMSDEQWLRSIHESRCNFANGNDPRNVPIQERSPYENGGFSSLTNDAASTEVQRNHEPNFREHFSIQPSASFSSVHSDLAQHQENLLPASIQASNFNSIIRHNSGRIGVDDADNLIHRDQFTNLDESFINDVVTPRPQRSHQPQSSAEVDLVSTFPCHHPINPHMRFFDARLQTFFENIDSWNSSSELLATPDELANAGLYCLGERDRTKCFYCNGGLQNWNREDDPWEEHAKWFPMCEFVLQQKGPDYVHRIVARFPNIRRPQMLNQITGTPQQNDSSVVPIGQSPSRISLSSNGGRTTSGLNPMHAHERENSGPVIVDPVVEARVRNQKIEDALRTSGLVTRARVMGFQENVIKMAVQRQFELHNENFTEMDNFIDGMIQASGNMQNHENPPVMNGNSGECQSSRTSSPSSISPQSALQEIQTLTQSRNCKCCGVNPACIVFIPCGHMACCQNCQNNSEYCPICRTFIREKIRSYLA